MQFIKFFLVGVLRYVCYVFSVFPIKYNKIVFYPENGRYYCNLKYISEYIDKYDESITQVWILNKNVYDMCGTNNIIVVNRKSIQSFYHLATSKIVIFNGILYPYFCKRNKQIYIETWHGGGAYKKIDAVYKNLKNYFERKRRMRIFHNIDYVISSCEKFSEVFCADTDTHNAKYLAYGMPRNDIFFNRKRMEQARDKVYKFYRISRNEKIVLYAPTFRDHGFQNILDSVALLKSLQDRFKNKFVLMLRCHPHITNSIFTENDTGNIINASDYADMQELLCASDILITDYSSCMWDFSLTYRPCFIFAPDLEVYKSERDFHTPVNEWPFPFANTNEKLSENILTFNEQAYVDKVQEHHNKLKSFEDGHATERVCNLIKRICSD